MQQTNQSLFEQLHVWPTFFLEMFYLIDQCPFNQFNFVCAELVDGRWCLKCLICSICRLNVAWLQQSHGMIQGSLCYRLYAMSRQHKNG